MAKEVISPGQNLAVVGVCFIRIRKEEFVGTSRLKTYYVEHSIMEACLLVPLYDV
jgi:hypothetical protein